MNKFDAHNSTGLFKLTITNLAKLILRDIDIQKNKKNLKGCMGTTHIHEKQLMGLKERTNRKNKESVTRLNC